MRTGSSTLNYLLGDHLGSTSITADSAGVRVAELMYKARGENRYTYLTTSTTFRFTGQRQESGLGGADGLYFYGARWYDPALGRFAQADTIVPGAGNPQALNRYSYSLSNPLKYTDPSGHSPCGGMFGALLGLLGFSSCAADPGQNVISDPLCVDCGAHGETYLPCDEECRAYGETYLRCDVECQAHVEGYDPGPRLDWSEGVDPAPQELQIYASKSGEPVEPYEVGIVKDLRSRSKGDKLDVHHAPQQHPAGQPIPGYDGDKAPGIVLPKPEHNVVPTLKGPYTGTPRDLVAKDIRNLRAHTGVPNSALRKLLDLIRKVLPGALDKK